MAAKRAQAGFTLIELLVVVLIIGILASIAIPQYFKVVERAKVAESHAFIANIKTGNEIYNSKNGNYLTVFGDLDQLDITIGGVSPVYGMKTYTVSAMSGITCPGGTAGFKMELQRSVANSGVSPRYGQYKVMYDACTRKISYPGCANCESDFK